MSQETGKEKMRSKNQAFFERMRREHGDWAEQWVDPGQQRVFIPQQMPCPPQFQNQFQLYPTQFQLPYPGLAYQQYPFQAQQQFQFTSQAQ